ncbi:Lipoprotein signal peptidase [Pseudidiomarina piscicola]|uniref:Lipoprotein signal peptidase n=1 Tax=Pseudidiomarina piscicola TaxID=2614830 RepID=A0A6S6WJT7_9GAMM|nr:signal peptidase II [Pseudidiomarina piscicola]CAB0149439.1 Lipoprotein signal peptidase [Pseudidiomarina piscicola]VZT38881.1 Lipoprotein signal peptidase [Pseudomonas aeruginosa]
MPKAKADFQKRLSGLQYLWLSLVLIIIDQVTKQWVLDAFDLYESIEIMPYLNFTYVQNFGAAFSFLSDQGGWQRWLFTGLAIAVSVILLVWLRRNPVNMWRQNLAFSLILAGAVGNVVDRLIHGFVIDFIDVYVDNWHWPAFNVADMAITIGAVLMLLEAFFEQRQEQQQS